MMKQVVAVSIFDAKPSRAIRDIVTFLGKKSMRFLLINRLFLLAIEEKESRKPPFQVRTATPRNGDALGRVRPR
jgi:hypothetical protein